MGIFNRNGKEKSKKPAKKEKEPGYGNWFFFSPKGTAAEPWPTAKELWEDPDVQKIIQAHNKSVRRRLKKLNK